MDVGGRSQTLEPDPEIKPLDQDYERHILERPLTLWEKRIGDQGFAQRVREDLDEVFRATHEARPVMISSLVMTILSVSPTLGASRTASPVC